MWHSTTAEGELSLTVDWTRAETGNNSPPFTDLTNTPSTLWDISKRVEFMFTVALAVKFFFFFQSLQPVTIAVMEVFFYVYSCFKNKLYSSSTVLILISSFQVFNAVSYSFKCLKWRFKRWLWFTVIIILRFWIIIWSCFHFYNALLKHTFSNITSKRFCVALLNCVL